MSSLREIRCNSRSAAVSSATSRSGLEKWSRWNCSTLLRLVLRTQPRSLTPPNQLKLKLQQLNLELQRRTAVRWRSSFSLSAICHE